MTNAKNRANMRCVKFSPEQLGILFAEAKKAGCSETDYIRWKTVGAVPGQQRKDAANRRHRRERAEKAQALAEQAIGPENGLKTGGGSPDVPGTPDLTDFNTELAVARVTRLDIPRVRELVAKGELKIVNGDVVLAGRLVGKL